MQQQQTEILQAIASLGRRLSQGEDKDGGLGAGQVDVKACPAARLTPSWTPSHRWRRPVSSPCERLFITKTIEEAPGDKEAYGADLMPPAHRASAGREDARQGAEIQKPLQDMETRFAGSPRPSQHQGDCSM